jgi:DNA-binding MarR family transcriptional regulator
MGIDGSRRAASAAAGDARAAEVLDALRRIVHALRHWSHAAERRLALSGAQLYVLQLLAKRPGASVGELAELTLTHQSSVSVVASRLVAAGYLSRRTARGDARRAELALTPAGRRLLARARQAPQLRLVGAVRRLEPRLLAAAAQALARIAAEVQVGARAPAMFFEEPARRRPRRGGPRVGR